MLFYLCIVSLCTNFLLVKCAENGNINITITTNADNCTGLAAYQFTEGQNITLTIESNTVINYGWLRYINSSKKLKLMTHGTISYSRTFTANKCLEGVWEFEFLHLIGNTNFKRNLLKVYKNNNYTVSICSTNVTIVPLKGAKDLNVKINVIVLAVTVAAALLIIVAQAAYIFYLKAQSKALNRHQNLSKKADPIGKDTARYCSNPGQKLLKDQVENEIETEYIYEAPNIELPDRVPGIPPPSQVPPQPPAITTMPRTPRSDHNTRIASQAMPAGTRHGPAHTPTDNNFTFPRPKPAAHELNVSNRPMMPLPPTAGGVERYEGTPWLDHNTRIASQTMQAGTRHSPAHTPTSNHSTFPRPKPAAHELNVASRPLMPLPPTAGGVELYEEMESEGNTYEAPSIFATLPSHPTPVPPYPNPRAPNKSGQKVQKPNYTLTSATMIPFNKPTRPHAVPVNNIPLPKTKPAVEAPKSGLRKPSVTPKPQLKAAAPSHNELEEAFKRRNTNNVKQIPIVSIPDPSTLRGHSSNSRPLLAAQSSPSAPQNIPEEIYSVEPHESSDEEWTYEPLKPFKGYDEDNNIYSNE